MKKVIPVIAFLLLGFSAFAQDFDDLDGVDAVFFDDIRSIEYRVRSEDENADPTKKISHLNEEIAALNKRSKVEDNTNRIDDLNAEIRKKNRQLDKVYSDKAQHDKWKSYYGDPLPILPILSLGSSQSIYFAFDDLHDETTNYAFTVIPYKWDWSAPLDLATSEYLDGYSYSTIDEYVYPELTLTNYVAYRFHFPNDEIRPTVSGNYLLVVYESNSEEVAFTRRVFVASQKFPFVNDVRGNSFQRDSLQNINFTISYPERYSQLAPARDVKVVVLQNGRYDNAIVKEKPALAMNRKLRYGYQDKIGFSPGKEFRFIMMQTLDYAQIKTEYVNQNKDGYEVFLSPQKERTYAPVFFYRDLNGKFATMNGVQNDELGDPDYAHVYFTYLKDDPYYQAELYIVGKFTDWQFKDEFRLSYNVREGRYEGEAWLKQGYYDYYYALKHGDSNKIDIDRTEGHSFQTKNDYTVLVYYTAPNGRLEELVATKSFSVN